jgi:hypothetical protein
MHPVARVSIDIMCAIIVIILMLGDFSPVCTDVTGPEDKAAGA